MNTSLFIFSIVFIVNILYSNLVNLNNLHAQPSEYSSQYSAHLASYNLSQSSESEKEAETLMFEALTFMNEGNFRKALEYIEKALVLSPDKFEYQYEQAVAYYKLKDYDKAIEILDKLTYDDKVNENVYQILAASYDFKGNKEDVFRVLKVGLSKFPNSGRLYYEKGVAELGLQKELDAINSWEKGVNLDPNYGNNYYQLINNYKNNDNKLWALLYGEVFLNISQNMNKSQEISKVIYDLLANNIYSFNTNNNSSNEENIDTTNQKNKKKVKKQKKSKAKLTYAIRLSDNDTSVEFIKILNEIYNQALNNIINGKNGKKYLEFIENEQKDKLTFEGIIKLREEVLKLWSESQNSKKYQVYILDYCNQMMSSKNHSTYSYMILAEGNPENAEKWIRKNTNAINNYVKWQQKNPFKIDKNSNYTKVDASK